MDGSESAIWNSISATRTLSDLFAAPSLSGYRTVRLIARKRLNKDDGTLSVAEVLDSVADLAQCSTLEQYRLRCDKQADVQAIYD